jgi:hypothetical protein
VGGVGVGGLQPRVARPKSTDSCCFQEGVVGVTRQAEFWELQTGFRGVVVFGNMVCYHNYTTPANERGPAPGPGSAWLWLLPGPWAAPCLRPLLCRCVRVRPQVHAPRCPGVAPRSDRAHRSAPPLMPPGRSLPAAASAAARRLLRRRPLER